MIHPAPGIVLAVMPRTGERQRLGEEPPGVELGSPALKPEVVTENTPKKGYGKVGESQVRIGTHTSWFGNHVKPLLQ